MSRANRATNWSPEDEVPNVSGKEAQEVFVLGLDRVQSNGSEVWTEGAEDPDRRIVRVDSLDGEIGQFHHWANRRGVDTSIREDVISVLEGDERFERRKEGQWKPDIGLGTFDAEIA